MLLTTYCPDDMKAREISNSISSVDFPALVDHTEQRKLIAETVCF